MSRIPNPYMDMTRSEFANAARLEPEVALQTGQYSHMDGFGEPATPEPPIPQPQATYTHAEMDQIMADAYEAAYSVITDLKRQHQQDLVEYEQKVISLRQVVSSLHDQLVKDATSVLKLLRNYQWRLRDEQSIDHVLELGIDAMHEHLSNLMLLKPEVLTGERPEPEKPHTPEPTLWDVKA